MYTLIAENESDERLQLTDNRNYDVLDVSGTSPPAANLNYSSIVGLDGALFNSSVVGIRNIVITLNIHHPIELNRIALYRFFRPKHKIRIYYANNSRDVYVDGYVETFENNPWTQLQQPQISIICCQPFWISAAETVVRFDNSIALFEFPFSIPDEGIEFSRYERLFSAFVNVGEIETGGLIRFEANDDGIENPKFYNRTTGEYIGFNITMNRGDVITVNTEQGKKSAVLLREGIKTNLLSYRSIGSTWVQFIAGTNEVSYDADEGAENLETNLTIVQKFEGV